MKIKIILFCLFISYFNSKILGQIKYLPPEDVLIVEESTSYYDTLALIDECKDLTTLFMNDEISTFFKRLKEIWILPNDELDYLEQKTIQQLNIVNERFGSVIGNKLVKSQYIDDLLYRLTYVVKFEYHAIQLRYTFYKGKDNLWYLNNFKWDDSISELLN